jgi:hypothetical protein
MFNDIEKQDRVVAHPLRDRKLPGVHSHADIIPDRRYGLCLCQFDADTIYPFVPQIFDDKAPSTSYVQYNGTGSSEFFDDIC